MLWTHKLQSKRDEETHTWKMCVSKLLLSFIMILFCHFLLIFLTRSSCCVFLLTSCWTLVNITLIRRRMKRKTPFLHKNNNSVGCLSVLRYSFSIWNWQLQESESINTLKKSLDKRCAEDKTLRRRLEVLELRTYLYCSASTAGREG